MSFIKISVAAIVFTFTVFALAGEGGEGGEGGGEKKKEKQEKSQATEYVEKTTKLNTIQVRLIDAQKEFDKLIEEKDKEKDQKKKDDIIKEMVEVSKNRNKDVDGYNKVRQELLYQYPAKTAELNRLYRLEEKKNVDDMQSTADLDEMLTRVKRVIEKKFAPFNPDNDKPKPAAKATLPLDQPAKLRLEK
jgi:hypothetical protein